MLKEDRNQRYKHRFKRKWKNRCLRKAETSEISIDFNKMGKIDAQGRPKPTV